MQTDACDVADQPTVNIGHVVSAFVEQSQVPLDNQSVLTFAVAVGVAAARRTVRRTMEMLAKVRALDPDLPTALGAEASFATTWRQSPTAVFNLFCRIVTTPYMDHVVTCEHLCTCVLLFYCNCLFWGLLGCLTRGCGASRSPPSAGGLEALPPSSDVRPFPSPPRW